MGQEDKVCPTNSTRLVDVGADGDSSGHSALSASESIDPRGTARTV